MDNKQLAQVFEAAKFVFPAYFSKLDARDFKRLCDTWAAFFVDDDPVVFTKALHACACTNTFFPSIAEMKAQIAQLTESPIMTEQEAWGLVLSALEHGASRNEQAWNELPHSIQRVIGSRNMLREWAMMKLTDLNTVIASNFMRSYRSVAEQEKKLQLLPSPIAMDIKMLAEQKRIGTPRLMSSVGTDEEI